MSILLRAQDKIKKSFKIVFLIWWPVHCRHMRVHQCVTLFTKAFGQRILKLVLLFTSGTFGMSTEYTYALSYVWINSWERKKNRSWLAPNITLWTDKKKDLSSLLKIYFRSYISCQLAALLKKIRNVIEKYNTKLNYTMKTSSTHITRT